MAKSFRWLLLVWGSVLLLSLPSIARGADTRGKFYTVIFGYEGIGNKAVDSHTFAVFIDGNAVARNQKNFFPTISWLPATGVVRPIRRERGNNFSLEETIAIAKRNDYAIRAYGPYEITPDLYRKAMFRIGQLNTGLIEYRMIGIFTDGAINCIRAVGDIVGDIHTRTEHGFSASEEVVEHFGSKLIRPADYLRNYIPFDPAIQFSVIP